MTDKFKSAVRVTAVGLAMLYGSTAMAPSAMAQDTPDPVATEEDDGGFDDWGLLGLLGLAGLAGLMRRPQPVVHETERRSDTIR